MQLNTCQIARSCPGTENISRCGWLTTDPVRIYGLVMNTGDLRARALDIFSAVLDAAHPHQLMSEALDLHGTILDIQGLGGRQTRLDLNDYERIVAVGAGKATAPMAGALEDLLQARLESGVISVKYGHTVPLDRIDVRESGHPVPDESGISATREILTTLFSLGSDDLAFVMLSGGGSALLDAYPEPITLDNAQDTFTVLLNSGAPIHEINVVRKHISSVKGGQLARLALPATVITLVLSDVIGDPLDIIASGPTVPDPSTFGDALAILDAYHVREQIPRPVMEHLEKGGRGEIPETPKEGDEGWQCCSSFLIGNNQLAMDTAAERAADLGLTPMILTTTMQGEASVVGEEMARNLKRALETGEPLSPPCCLIAGGETTCTIGSDCGLGGRSQELALAAARELRDTGNAVLLAAGTDGTDGPTDAAGGIVDGETVGRGVEKGLILDEYLEGHNAYPFLQSTGCLIKTGPTMTNIMDIVLMLAGTE